MTGSFVDICLYVYIFFVIYLFIVFFINAVGYQMKSHGKQTLYRKAIDFFISRENELLLIFAKECFAAR